MLKMALLIHLIIIVCEGCTLGHIRKKTDILKYYTYLQNLLALAASFVLLIYLIMHAVSGSEIPAFVKGLRYIATCGLAATMLMFLTFLGGGKKLALTEDDFLPGFSPETANAVLHYICPLLCVISFVVFERELPLSDGIWTSLAAVPSCVYWAAYILLSTAKLWEEPYAFVSQNAKNKAQEMLPFFVIPLLFIAVSFVLWTVK